MSWMFVFAILETFPLCILWYLPFQEKLRVSRGWVLLGMLTLVAAQGIIYITLERTELMHPAVTLPLWCFFLGLHILLMVLLIRTTFSKIMFVVLLTVPYGVLLLGTFSWIEIVLGLPQDYRLFTLVRVLLILAAYPPARWFIRRYVTPAMPADSKEIWQGAWCVPLMFAVCALLVTLSPVRVSGRGSLMLLVRVLMTFGSTFSCYYLVRAQRQAEVRAELTERIRFSESLVALQKQQYTALAEMLRANRTVRHDFHHHFSVIRALAERGETQKLCAYLDGYSSALPQEAEPAVCDNPIANVVVGHYLSVARAQNIAVDCTLHLEHDIGVRDTDLCVLLGNLLENAIEACLAVPQPQRFIRVRSGSMGDGLYLTLDNSYDGVVHKRGELYCSTKDKQRGGTEEGMIYHEGLGLSSVQAIVNRYNGVLKIQHTETTFMVSAMLETAVSLPEVLLGKTKTE